MKNNNENQDEEVMMLAGGSKRRAREVEVVWETIAAGAVKLDLSPQALRARCRRAARKRGKEIVADLGMGVIAKRFGDFSWRIFIPPTSRSEERRE